MLYFLLFVVAEPVFVPEVVEFVAPDNLNIVMKILASITLILSIPTIISGIYGMNNPRIPMIEYWWFPLGLSAVSMFITWIILKHKNML